MLPPTASLSSLLHSVPQWDLRRQKDIADFKEENSSDPGVGGSEVPQPTMHAIYMNYASKPISWAGDLQCLCSRHPWGGPCWLSGAALSWWGLPLHCDMSWTDQNSTPQSWMGAGRGG
jgi:hypothetical protein